MARIETWFEQDLKKPVVVHMLNGNVFSMDNEGNLIGVRVTDDGQPASLTGSVSGSIIRQDGVTIAVIGTLSGNTASIILPQDAYLVPGLVTITIKLEDNGVVTTLVALTAIVYRTSTDTIVDPGTIIPSIETLIAEIEDAIASIPADYSSLWTSLAPAFNTSTEYNAGQYVTYDGGVYRFVINHPVGSWNSTQTTKVDLAGDIFDLKSKINIMHELCPFPSNSFILGKNVDGSGNIATNNYTAMSQRVAVTPGDVIYRFVPEGVNNRALLFYVSEFAGSTFIKRTQVTNLGGSVTIGATTDNIIVSFGRVSSSGVEITQADVDNYFSVELYRKVPSKADDYVFRGNIADLGYTALSQCVKPGYYTFRTSDCDSLSDIPATLHSGAVLLTYPKEQANSGTTWQKIFSTNGIYVRYGASSSWYSDFRMHGTITERGYTSLSQCTTPGYYMFNGSDSLSDLPNGWTGGGLLITYAREGLDTIWQELVSTVGTYVRYGTSGAWYSKHINNLVRAEYNASSGSDNSTEQLDIWIPIDDNGRTMRYNMGHCVDAEKNANVWRIMYSYLISGNGNSSRQMTIRGEWECAVHLANRPDFSGGVVHGDEVEDSIVAFVDGVQKNMSEISGYCKELKIVRHSNLYDPNDSTTIIAEHGVEYTFNLDGVKVKQAVKWKVSATLTACYLAMLPIAKAYSQYRYDDTDFGIVENTETNYSITIPNARSVTEYSDTYKDLWTMSVGNYPTGMTGGDCALIADNGGGGYNKVYFPVCSSGSIESGEIWKSITTYKNR